MAAPGKQLAAADDRTAIPLNVRSPPSLGVLSQ